MYANKQIRKQKEKIRTGAMSKYTRTNNSQTREINCVQTLHTTGIYIKKHKNSHKQKSTHTHTRTHTDDKTTCVVEPTTNKAGQYKYSRHEKK